MDRKGKYNTAKLIVSSIATTIGAIFVILKIYSHVGMILFSFGGVILALSLEARKKEISSDELTEWISGKAAVWAFWATWSSIVLLLAADIYKPNFLETYIALGIVMIATVGALFAGMYYYGKINKNLGS